MANVKAVPDGTHTITPALNVKGAARMIEFLKKALGAEERMRMLGPGDQIVHAELRVGDSTIYIAEAQRDPETVSEFTLFSADCDAAFKRMVDAGGKATMPPTNMFWGDRMGRVDDAWGNRWFFMTHVEDVAPDEMEKRKQAFFAQLAAQQK